MWYEIDSMPHTDVDNASPLAGLNKKDEQKSMDSNNQLVMLCIPEGYTIDYGAIELRIPLNAQLFDF